MEVVQLVMYTFRIGFSYHVGVWWVCILGFALGFRWWVSLRLNREFYTFRNLFVYLAGWLVI